MTFVITTNNQELSNHLEHVLGKTQLYCDGFNLPRGLKVTLTYDGHSCKISGIPAQEQANTMAYVVTANKTGRSLAEVPIVVNALILHE